MARKSRERLAMERRMAELKLQIDCYQREAEESLGFADAAKATLDVLEAVLDAAKDKAYDGPEDEQQPEGDG